MDDLDIRYGSSKGEGRWKMWSDSEQDEYGGEGLSTAENVSLGRCWWTSNGYLLGSEKWPCPKAAFYPNYLFVLRYSLCPKSSLFPWLPFSTLPAHNNVLTV